MFLATFMKTIFNLCYTNVFRNLKKKIVKTILILSNIWLLKMVFKNNDPNNENCLRGI